jgi:superfamily II DNA or RNA helicase
VQPHGVDRKALFFAQAVGRFVRARRRGETASVFVPSVPALLGFAAEDELLAQAQAEQTTPDADELSAFQALITGLVRSRAL